LKPHSLILACGLARIPASRPKIGVTKGARVASNDVQESTGSVKGCGKGNNTPNA